MGCSLVADQVAHPAHLNARNTSLAFVSRAPQADIEGLKSRMGWEFIPWYTLTDDFDADFGVDEWHGTNAFIRDDDRVYRTYFLNNRGDEAMGGTWSYLDITALGRQEDWELPKSVLNKRQDLAAGGLGGLASGPSPNPALSLVELSRRVPAGRLADSRAITGYARERAC